MAGIVVVSLAGCGAADEAGDESVATAVGSDRTGGSGALDDELGYSVRFAPGPLNDLLGMVTFDNAADLVADLRAQEERKSQCMAEQGFEYVPVVPTVESVTLFDGADQGSPAFVEEYGFGVSRQPAGTSGQYTYTAPLDENGTIVEGMSPAEREAYDAAMWGGIVEQAEGDEGAAPGERAGGGCYDQAMLDVSDWADTTSEAVDDARRFLVAASTNSVFDSLNAEWAECVRGLGYVDSSPELMAWRVNGVDLDGNPTGERATLEDEMSAARADLECRRQTHYDTRYRDLNHRLQADYIADAPELQTILDH